MLNLNAPESFADFLPEDLYIKKEIETRIENVFVKYGYSFIQSPTLEHAGTYSHLTDTSAMYRIEGDAQIEDAIRLLKAIAEIPGFEWNK